MRFSGLSPKNEPVRFYAPGSAERASLTAAIDQMREPIEIASIIAGRAVETGLIETAICPHDHRRVLATAHLAGDAEIAAAIAAARAARHDWSRMDWQARARIFLKAADLVSGPWRDRLNAATMLGQSKTVHQAEIDAAAEFADFLRFNVSFLERLMAEQPISPEGVWNRVEYRPLDGFVYAVTPFNFTAIAGNLPTAPALLGNTVVWKPSNGAKLSAHYIMVLLSEAGLPDGVINLVFGDPARVTALVLDDSDLAGLHFTGSSEVFDRLSLDIAGRRYRGYPRIVGETGGKNFTLVHRSADPAEVATAIIRGGYEYQGQKCSATSRAYIPRALWPEVRDRLVADIESIRVADVADFSAFMGAVIDERAWHRLDSAITEGCVAPDIDIVAGAPPSMADGYFVPPTLFETRDPGHRLMRQELFGPVVTAFVYDDAGFADVLDLIDRESDYALTGALFARDSAAVTLATDRLRDAAGNFYINDKSTGAVVGQQPFGGARRSGTNDKAGSMWNLARWASPRTIKESFVAPTDYRYPSMG